MKKCVVFCSVLLVFFSSCTKQIDGIISGSTKDVALSNQFVQYTIAEGKQYCDQNVYTASTYSEQKFVVRFDSSAVYKTVASSNQVDINKLFGFSDNNAQHHQYSARIGWRWSNNALRLFAYVYNDGVVSYKELTTVAIGAEINCSIKVSGNSYVFTVGDKVDTMPRTSTTEQAVGYKLYPYFGGDEMAPHAISIWIKEIR
jgi:hypothetical protein